MFPKGSDIMFTKKIITSFGKITLSESGMRGTQIYEIICIGDTSTVSLYQKIYSRGEDERRLLKSAGCSTEAFIKLLNDCDVCKWDGFSGKHPRGVKDGIMFRFTAEINGGVAIRAEGSQNFPRRYRDFTNGLYEILNG